MEFCANCGTRLVLTNGAQATPILLCPKCGYANSSWVKQYKLYKPVARPSEIVVLDRKLRLKTLPTMKAICPRCMNMEAECWMVTFGSIGTGYVSFFRCTSCGQTWREKD